MVIYRSCPAGSEKKRIKSKRDPGNEKKILTKRIACDNIQRLPDEQLAGRATALKKFEKDEKSS